MSDIIKLHYFSARGRAEPLRMTLTIAGKAFEDIKCTWEQWGKKKDKAPYGQVPYIEYKGRVYGESKAIAGFVARECGMAGKTSEDAMRVDEVYCLVQSLLEAFAKTRLQTDPAQKEEMQKKLVSETIPKFLGFFEKLLGAEGKGYFVGSALTLADLAVYDITYSLLKQNPKLLDSYPEITKMRKNLEADKNVKAYLDSRPDSDM